MDLLTPELKMQKYGDSDFEYFCDVICNDKVMHHISGRGNSKAVAKVKFKAILKINQENDLYGFYKVIQLGSKKVIGFAKVVPFEKECIEIGYALLAPFWRKGYTLGMIEKMTQHCLQFFPNKKIMAIVNKGNEGSVKVLEKCNYKEYKKELFNGNLCLFFEFNPHRL